MVQINSFPAFSVQKLYNKMFITGLWGSPFPGLMASTRSPFHHASFLPSARERPELEMTLLSEVPVGFIYRPLHRSTLPSFPQPHYHSLNFLFPLVLELHSMGICIESSPLHPTTITPSPTHLYAATQFAATLSDRRMRSNVFTTPS